MIAMKKTKALATAWLAGILPLAAAESPDQRTWPGISADRAARQVRVAAEATGVAGHINTEFFLIHRSSGHDYEAIAVTDALPSDLHAALEFIGVPAGRPVDPERAYFWPRGERVAVRIGWTPTNGVARTAPAEEFILDRRTGNPLPVEGFVFTGAPRVPDPADTNRLVYAADVFEPNALIPAFNLRAAVLDIPRRGSQGALYDRQVAQPDRTLPAGQPLTILVEPFSAAGAAVHPMDAILAVGPSKDPAPAIALHEAGADPDHAASGWEAAVRQLAEWRNAGREPFVRILPADAVTVDALRALPERVELLIQAGARIEPAPGEIYYVAFNPPEAYRDRENRPEQPWELHLKKESGNLAGTLIRLRYAQDDATGNLRVETQEYPTPSPAALRAMLDQHGPGYPAILVFVPDGLDYGELKRFLAPALPTHPMIHVYPALPPAPEKPAATP